MVRKADPFAALRKDKSGPKLAEEGGCRFRDGEAGGAVVAAGALALVDADALFAVLVAAAGALALQDVDALAVHTAVDPVDLAENLLPLAIDGTGAGGLCFCQGGLRGGRSLAYNQDMALETIYDVAVLGAGAAGMLCAAEAGKRGRRVVLIDAGERVGRKILISGGGRCNFTNERCTPANFLSENPHFAKSALARYTPQDFIALVQKHRIPFHEKTLGQLFCDGSAQAIVTMLEAECRDAGVETRMRTQVLGVARDGDGFAVRVLNGMVRARTVVVATGGLSIPKMGATGVGYDVAREFGLRVVEPRPALVPLTFHGDDTEQWADLSGLSAEVVASVDGAAWFAKGRKAAPVFREKMLITHRGLSGPAVLQVSSYWRAGERVRFDLVPETAVFAPLTEPRAVRDGNAAYDLLRAWLPARMAERWLRLNLPADWKTPSIVKLESALHAWTVTPGGDEGYAKAEVTAGGVSTAELDSGTMQAKRVPGLAFIGEVVDVTGHLGGHNFQWAWSSAVAAAQAV